jgi:PAS domain S-box-containing protein
VGPVRLSPNTPSDAEHVAELGSVLLASADAELRFLFLNGAWERLLGWLPEELAGSSVIDLMHPDERRVVVPALAEARESDPPELDFDCRVSTRDGHWRLMSFRVRFHEGRWYAAGLAQAKPGAEKRLAAREAQLRALVEQVPAIVYTAGLGADAPWDYVSPQIESLLGYTAEEWVGRRDLWWDALHPDDRAHALEDEDDSARPGGQLRSEYRLRRRDGD